MLRATNVQGRVGRASPHEIAKRAGDERRRVLFERMKKRKAISGEQVTPEADREGLGGGTSLTEADEYWATLRHLVDKRILAAHSKVANLEGGKDRMMKRELSGGPEERGGAETDAALAVSRGIGSSPPLGHDGSRSSLLADDGRSELAGVRGPVSDAPWWHFVAFGLEHLNIETTAARRAWNLAIVAMIMYSVVVLPFRLGFEVPATGAFFIIEVVVIDCFFGLDIVINLFTHRSSSKRVRLGVLPARRHAALAPRGDLLGLAASCPSHEAGSPARGTDGVDEGSRRPPERDRVGEAVADARSRGSARPLGGMMIGSSPSGISVGYHSITSSRRSELVLDLPWRPFACRDGCRTDAYRYMRFWFWIDLLSTLPVDLIVVALIGSGHGLAGLRLVRILRLTRLLKLVRLVKLRRVMSSLTSPSTNIVALAFVRLGRIIVLIFLMAHVLSCVFHYLTILETDGESGRSGSWLDSVDKPSIDTSELWSRYLLSLYWVVATLMAVGYGDVFAITSAERLYSVFTQALGAVFFGIIVANVSSLLDMLNAKSIAMSRRMDEVREYMLDRKLPLQMQRRLLDYFQHFYSQKSLFNEEEILAGLSKTLRNELVLAGAPEALDSMFVLRRDDPTLLSKLMTCFKPALHMPGDMIAEEGDIGRELFFLTKGTVDVLADLPPEFLIMEDFSVRWAAKMTPEERRASLRMYPGQRFELDGEGAVDVDAQVGELDEGEDGDDEGSVIGTMPSATGFPSASSSTKTIGWYARASNATPPPKPALLLGMYTEGRHFGDVSVFLEVRRPVGYRASVVCSVQALTKQDLEIVLFDFADTYRRMHALAEKRAKLLQAAAVAQLQRARENGLMPTAASLPHIQAANERMRLAYKRTLEKANAERERLRESRNRKKELLKRMALRGRGSPAVHPVTDSVLSRDSVLSVAAEEPTSQAGARDEDDSKAARKEGGRDDDREAVASASMATPAAAAWPKPDPAAKAAAGVSPDLAAAKTTMTAPDSTPASAPEASGDELLEEMADELHAADLRLGVADAAVLHRVDAAEGAAAEQGLLQFLSQPKLVVLPNPDDGKMSSDDYGVVEVIERSGLDTPSAASSSSSDPGDETAGADTEAARGARPGVEAEAGSGAAAEHDEEGPEADPEQVSGAYRAAGAAAPKPLQEEEPQVHRGGLLFNDHFVAEEELPAGSLGASDDSEAVLVRVIRQSRVPPFDREETIESQRSLRRRLVLHPGDALRVRMDMIMAVLILVTLVEVPFVIGFHVDEVEAPELVILDTVVDIVFLIELFMNFRTAFDARKASSAPSRTAPGAEAGILHLCGWACRPSRGEVDSTEDAAPPAPQRSAQDQHRLEAVNTVSRDMAMHYLSTNFLVDVISTVPFDTLIRLAMGDSTGGDGFRTLKLIRTIRLFRLLKLFRFFRLRRLVRRLQLHIFMSPALLALVGIGMQVLIGAHILACLLFYASVARSDSRAAALDEDNWWSARVGGSLGEQYIAAIYLAFTTMTTVGYGDLVPKTVTEVTVTIFAMLIGATVFGYIVGSVASLVARVDSSGMRHQAKMSEVLEYLHEKRTPKPLRAKVIRYFDYVLARKSAFSEDVILSDLSENLRREVVLYMNMEIIRKVPYFFHKDREFVTLLVSLLRPHFAHAGVFLYKETERASEMLFLIKGQVEILRGAETAQEQRHAVLTPGSYFGELALLMGIRRSSSARALTQVNLFLLTKDDLRSTVAYYPQLAAKMEESLRMTLDKLAVGKEAAAAKSRRRTAGGIANAFVTTLMRDIQRKEVTALAKSRLRPDGHDVDGEGEEDGARPRYGEEAAPEGGGDSGERVERARTLHAPSEEGAGGWSDPRRESVMLSAAGRSRKLSGILSPSLAEALYSSRKHRSMSRKTSLARLRTLAKDKPPGAKIEVSAKDLQDVIGRQ